MKTVNVVLGLRNGTKTLGEGGVISTQEKEHTRNGEQDEGERVQPQQPQAGGNGVPKQPWVSLFKPKPLTSKGVSLSFIAPTVCDGSPVAMLEQTDLDEMSVIWESAVIMYVVGDRPSIGAVIRFVEKDWNIFSKPQVLLHEEGYFVIKFASKKERDSILMAGPHSFFGKPVIVKPWSPEFNFQAEVLRVVPIWVRFPNLPLNCWGAGSLSRIGSLLGVPLFADECTTCQQRISFARILIEIDVTKSLPRNVMLKDPTGKIFKQQKKVQKVWVSKQIVVVEEPKQVSESVNVMVEDETSNEMGTSMDPVITPKAPIQDDGWRVVSRRRRVTSSPVYNTGLAQVGYAGEDGGEVGAPSHIPP
ncbi:uncharacterized protein [Spinacia oleracea]|uniref:DUF4283 domain-containing protein n=1 Tax=Spinacia oleracea TaxID=3562 RepID=A0A9R0K8B0_SPIOL|nr:uncharacterized protein LOC110801219 [Spinacia oleracea]